MADRVGQQIGNYRLIRMLGKGGFAEVYLGQHIHINLQVAIKILHTRLAQDFQLEFLKEADLIARLKHPHIIRIMDFGIEDDTPYIIMDYAPQGTLRTRHPRGSSVPIETVVSYTKQIAIAIQYAHDHKLIHRDIKPGNLLIGEDGEIVLSDFGLASIANSTTSIETGIYSGTIPYSAPEQILGKPRRESDQYSLGIAVYEWLSGESPFRGTTMEVISQHLSAPPRPLHGNIPDISPEVENIVMRALAKEPKQRFSRVQDFATALEQASQSTNNPLIQVSGSTLQPNQGSQAEESAISPTNSERQPDFAESSQSIALPVQLDSRPIDTSAPTEELPFADKANPGAIKELPQSAPESLPLSEMITLLKSAAPLDSPTAPTSRDVSRRRVVLGLGLGGLVVVSGGLIKLLSSRTAQITPSPSPTLAHSPIPTVIHSPTPIPIPIGTLLYLYKGHTDFVNAVAWSPDGKRIASGGYDMTVQVWDAVNGSNVFKYTAHLGTIFAVAWSPNDKHIASGSMDKTARVWNAVDGSNVIKFQGHSDIVYVVAWSPNGKLIASGGLDKTVQIWDASSGDIVYKYTGHSDAVNGVAWSPDGKRIASGSWDTTVQVWGASSGNLIHKYQGHTDSVFAVAWSPDGKRLASASVDKTVQVWWVG